MLTNSIMNTSSGSGSTGKTRAPSTAGSPKSGPTSSKKPSKNGDDLREVLFNHHMVIRDQEAAERASALIETARNMVKGDRNSAIGPTSLKKFLKARNHLVTANENTFVHKLLTRIMRDERQIKLSADGDSSMEIRWEFREWEDDYLDINLDVEFRRESITAMNLADDPALERVKNPKPDIAFGFMRNALTPDQRQTNNIYNMYTEVSPRICGTFLIFECKGGVGGTLQEAVTQGCRAGAAMVSVIRKLHALVDTEIRHGVDDTSFAFSICLTPDQAQLSLHWAEAVQGTVTFYMQKIEKYDLDEKDDVKELRRDLDNILDWGILERKQAICKILDAIKAQTPPGASGPAGKKRKTG